MTAAEMITLFRERYNLSSNIGDHKDSSQIYLLLNEAVDRFVASKFTGNNPREEDFEGDAKRFDDLRTIVTQSGPLSTAGANVLYDNGVTYTLPADYRFLIKGFAEISSDWYPCERIPHETSDVFIQTGRNLPNLRDQPKILMGGVDSIIVLHDSDDTVTNARILYIANPATISGGTNCDLPNHTHHEIVEMAVGLAIEGLENPTRAQTHTAKLQGAE